MFLKFSEGVGAHCSPGLSCSEWSRAEERQEARRGSWEPFLGPLPCRGCNSLLTQPTHRPGVWKLLQMDNSIVCLLLSFSFPSSQGTSNFILKAQILSIKNMASWVIYSIYVSSCDFSYLIWRGEIFHLAVITP